MSLSVFDWNNKKLWISDIDIYAKNLLTPKVKNLISRSRSECWSDDFSWLPILDGEEQFAEAFRGYYDSIRSFHGCRPVNVLTYFSQGVQGQISEALHQSFLEIYSDVPKSFLESVVFEFANRSKAERGKFWVVLGEDELIDNCGHYVIQGSEYLMAMAASLWRYDKSEDYRLRLRKIGTPTIFEMHVPVACFADAQVSALSRLVLSAWGELVAKKPLGFDHSPCLTVSGSIDPKYIVSHRHPGIIKDPHFGFVPYINILNKCPACDD